MKTEIIAIPELGKEIIWEKNIIRIPFNTENERDKGIYNLIQNLQNKLDKLEKEKNEICLLSVTNIEAEKRIINYLKGLRKEGHGKFDIPQICIELKLPAQQIELILEKLEKKGLIKEED